MLRLKLTKGDLDRDFPQLQRELLLVASVFGVTADHELNELHLAGDPDPHLVEIQLRNAGFAAVPVKEAPQHPRFRAGLG